MVKLRDNKPVLPDGSINVAEWLVEVSEGRNAEEMAVLSKACALAVEFGKTVLTPLSVSCLNQGLITAGILHSLGLDTPTIAAAIVYDSYCYANLSLKKIQETLGLEVEKLILGVQKIDQVSTHHTSSRYVENLRRMLLSIVEDIRVVLIKLASHTAKMRSAVHSSDTIRRQMAEETQEIYAPLANRLGIGQIKWELEDYAFRFLEPIHYKAIATLLDERRIHREDYIDSVVHQITDILLSEGIEATVSGRAKHIYSIWKKMQRKGVGYHEIYDVRAIRVLVPTVRDCYAALGEVHTLWQHIPKEFDDYIANPKANGYRSLHTAVIGPEGKTIEVQIRSPEMHDQAELGVAAHWRYKENVTRDTHYEVKLASLRQVLKWQEEWEIDQESSEALRQEVFQDRLYVLTPKGEVLDLPVGATVLDFAYSIHSEIGHRCRGAKVNGRMVPLIQVLKSGDKVEILTAKTGGPSRDWLNRDLGYIKTSRARSKVLQWFRKQDRSQNIQDGRETIDRELKRLNLENINLESLANHLKISKVDDMLAAIGSGEIRLSQILGAIQEELQPLVKTPMPLAFEPLRLRSKERSAEIMVSGVGNLLCQTARCCKPVPGDEIIGYITIGRGVSVHRKDCINILHVSQDKMNRLIQVEWGYEIQNQYSVDIMIHAYDREGLLHDISSILSMERINVLAINTLSNKRNNTADFRLTIEISGIELLSKILNRILQLPNVIEAKRV